MSRKSKSTLRSKSGSATVIFKSKETKNVWAKTYTSFPAAARAIKGVVSKTHNSMVTVRPAKGFKYGKLLKRINDQPFSKR